MTGGNTGVSSVSGPGSVPQPGMGIFAMMASLGTMPLPVPTLHQTTQYGTYDGDETKLTISLQALYF